jgi:hypothetical protein
MVAVFGPFVGDSYPLRGIGGAGMPWMIEEGRGSLEADGDLIVNVRGLVIKETGMNPLPHFKAIVSCLAVEHADAMLNVVLANMETALYPADEAGNATIVAKVMLPKVCVNPVVFVATSEGYWLSTTGLKMAKAGEEVDEE